MNSDASESLYLILHKVRGEPAFDIAQRLQIGDEEGWIIPTSGHRAYPFKWWELQELSYIADINQHGYHPAPWTYDDKLPEDWPDHYSPRQAASTPAKSLGSLLSLVKKVPRLQIRRLP